VAPVIIGPGARAWLHRAAPGLMRIARTRRALLRLEAKLPPSPKPALRPAGHNPPVPLPVAEAKFREVYVRGLLATTPNRAQAAARAGITYRTLCRICQDVEAALARSAARRHRRKKQHSRSASREKRR
jgi:hypothetical protein